MTNPLLSEIQHGSFPQVAEALRSRTDAIAQDWVAALREAIPHMDRLTFEQLKDSTPLILPAIADALASEDPEQIAGVLEHAPKQGLARFHQQQDVSEVMHEDRLLRAIVVLHVEQEMGRQMNVGESAALHATLDVMLQQSVVALVNEQQAMLRAAAETELKYLSFLSHDLNNNLSAVVLSLNALRRELGSSATDSRAVRLIDSAKMAIQDTTHGMKQLLEHERLRKSSDGIKTEDVNLNEVISLAAQRFVPQLQAKGLTIQVEPISDGKVRSNAELIGIVLQNLLGNAVKYSSRGVIRVGAEERAVGDSARWVIWVSDEGPGIAPHQQERLFEAFKRGDLHGQEGVGLGLAIVSQAAKLLEAEVSFESTMGTGTTFYLLLPGERDNAGRS